MTRYPFAQVDVFTARPFYGNPVAVVFPDGDIDPALMQRIAAWTNLSETTFVLPPSPGVEADYRLRIFTPQHELPFAGHPTVGSAHAYLERHGAPAGGVLRQECGAGILALRTEGEGSERIIFAETPEARIVHEFGTSVEALSAALGAEVSADPPPASVYNGPTWLFARLADPTAMSNLPLDQSAIARLSLDCHVSGVAAFALTDGDPAVHIRCLAPAYGITEDPVTGSANGALPTYLSRFGLLERTGRRYVAKQGMEIGRDGRVHVIAGEDGRTQIGGQATTLITGEIEVQE